MPRQRQHESNADRQSAYRKRKRNEQGGNIAQSSLRLIAEIQGVSLSYIRLMKSITRVRPDLESRIRSGEITIGAAAVEAGIRAQRASVPTNDVDKAIAVLRKYYSPDQLIAALAMRGDLEATDEVVS